MGAAVLVFAFLPWLDRSPVKSIRYRGIYFKTALTLFVISFLILGWLGTLPPAQLGEIAGISVVTLLSRILGVVYFLFFILMPWYSKIDPVKPVPDRVTM